MKKIFSYLLQGILYIAPIALTVYIIYGVFIFLDDLLQKILVHYFDEKIHGLGILILILFLIFTGYLGQSIIANPLKKLLKKTIERIPFIKFIHSAINDLFSAFLGKENKFNKPVLVKVNKDSDLEKLGFITEDDLSQFEILDKIAVYFPHSYNFSGELFIVPKENVKEINIPSSDVMKFIVSAGLIYAKKK